MCVALPIFHDGRLLGFAAATAHLIDIGAAAPGLNVDLIGLYAEGLLINSIKLYERGRRNEALWTLLHDSVRTPAPLQWRPPSGAPARTAGRR